MSAPREHWFNRSTVGLSLASLFSDVSHELATAVLPLLLLGIGAGPAALGIIEGSADGISAVAKLWGGIRADRLQRRKPFAAVGYFATAVGIAAIGLCTQAWQVLLCRMAAWIGRGSRSASRDVLMTENAPAESMGKAFGMERAGDAMGAMLGPLIALGLVTFGSAPREIVKWSLVPGLCAVFSILLLVRERPGVETGTRRSFRASLAGTGKPFRRYLAGILVFGSGDFSRTMLILYATEHLKHGIGRISAAGLAIALYVMHNAVSTVAAFPIGALTDRIGRKPVLVVGYLFAAATTLAFALFPPTPGVLIALFVCSGLYIACEEVAEKAYAAELLPKEVKGTGMGVLAAVNGVGDMISSALLGALWAAFPLRAGIGFAVAAGLQGCGALIIGGSRDRDREAGSS